MQTVRHKTQSSGRTIQESLISRSAWTEKEYEHLRECALALVRSHQRIDCTHIHGYPRIITTVDGRALWDLMGALDRVNRDRRR